MMNMFSFMTVVIKSALFLTLVVCLLVISVLLKKN